jgi:hypothetical protein
MADFNSGWRGVGFLRADLSGPRKKKSMGQCETIHETGDLPFGSVPGSFFATGLAVADNPLFLRSREHRKEGSKHTFYWYWLIVIVINNHLF